ncbi:MAG: FAD-dependent oxidoreductase [Negativicutes bacterium]|nr:FAD-dependent oxidoreductase [Negativicutes bacterium]
MFKISGLDGHKRMSTQDLLQAVNQALAAGETEFHIEASGQHDIGGPLWHPEGKTLKFFVSNPGQRLGSMCLEGTEILVDGPAPADVGWLNAGGKIVVRGDGGDTTAHCAASGTIYIGGRAGTRSGSMMKHDPLYSAPEFWVLKNAGSFSFEFMSGGIAVVCGYDSEEFESVLGDRSCVGMVGGILYFRGKASGISQKDVKIKPLESADIEYLAGQMGDFLAAINRPEIKDELTDWTEWQKVVPLTYDERPKKTNTDTFSFRRNDWVAGGIFGDVTVDDFNVIGLVTTGLYRQRTPQWEDARYSAPCEFNCTASIPSQQRFNLLREGKIDEAYRLILEYTPFPGSICGAVCPNLCMDECTRAEVDISAQIGQLGTYSLDVTLSAPDKKTGKSVGIIGGGPAGLTAAWQLARKGHSVTVYEAGDRLGGKMEQVIPRSRLPQATLEKELQRIQDLGVEFKPGVKVDAEKFQALRGSHDAVVVATGGHISRVIPWPGHERIVKGIDFLKAINCGETPKVGKQVIVIGCGNSGMDAAVGAYQMGAQEVICIDVQAPAAFAKEIEHVQSMGGVLLWPVQTKEITAEGIITQDGKLIKGDTVIISIGESPDLSFLPADIPLQRGYLQPAENYSIAAGIFTAGDTVRPGRLVDAVGAGRQAAFAADAYLMDGSYKPEVKQKVPAERISTAYFKRCHSCDLPSPTEDYNRCISCGTCRDCHMCLKSCPENAITREALPDGSYQYVSDADKCIGCGICAGMCPCGIWTMYENAEPINMYKV